MSDLQDKKNYLDYVINTLGVSSFFDDNALHVLHTTGLVNKKMQLLVRVQDYENYQASEIELLGKMLGALKIDSKLIQIISMSSTVSSPSAFILDLADHEKSKATDQNLIQTYSPRRLLKDPQLKQQAWEDLKKLIQFFNTPK